MRPLTALALLAACADPVVEMQLLLPTNADSFDTSCITAVDMRVIGNDYLQDSTDYRRACIDVQGGATYASVRDAIRGRLDVGIPDSGIAGVEIYGWSAPSACNYEDEPFVTPDLLFFGRGDYLGDEYIYVPLVPNVGCARSDVKVRMVDMFALVDGATCDEAGTVIGAAGIGIGTLVPRMHGKGSRFFGALAGAAPIANLATFTGPTQVGPRACLALSGGDEALAGSVSCAIGGATICAAAGEMELATVPYAITANTANFDSTVMVKFPGLIYGSVWGGTTMKSPLAGATVTVDPKHGKVIYVDPPNEAGVMAVRADQSATGPSGLFTLYTDTLVDVKIAGGGVSRTVTLGAMDESPAGALVVL